MQQTPQHNTTINKKKRIRRIVKIQKKQHHVYCDIGLKPPVLSNPVTAPEQLSHDKQSKMQHEEGNIQENTNLGQSVQRGRGHGAQVGTTICINVVIVMVAATAATTASAVCVLKVRKWPPAPLLYGGQDHVIDWKRLVHA
jgi:hypothetical protein